MIEIKDIIENDKPDIFGITEILNKSNPTITAAELHIEGYDCFYNNDKWERGIALYFKSTLNAKKYTKFDEIDFTESDWGTFTSENKESLLIGCIYRSGSSSQQNLEQLNLLIKNPKIDKFDKTFIAGDFNFPNIRWGEANEKDFSEVINDAFLIQHITNPTRYRENQKSNIHTGSGAYKRN